MDNIETLKKQWRERRDAENNVKLKNELEKLDKIITTKDGKTVFKKINDKYYTFRSEVCPTGTIKYTIIIKNNILDIPYYQRSYFKIPCKWKYIFKELV